MKYHVRVSPKADSPIDELDAWWTENRPASSARVASEVVRTLLLLAEMPGIGGIYKRRKGRVALRRLCSLAAELGWRGFIQPPVDGFVRYDLQQRWCA